MFNKDKLPTAVVYLFILTGVILISLVILKMLQLTPQGWKAKTDNPISPILKISPSPIPKSSPKEYKYDSSTDLEAELDLINPQILDSDFE